MMHRMASLVFSLLVLFGVAPGLASAIVVAPPPTSEFDFTGTCSDCAGTAKAELILQNYAIGSNISSANFVSFHYDGSNLLPAFTVTTANLNSVTGVMSSSTSAAEALTIFADGYKTQFISRKNTSNTWCAGPNCASDQGVNDSWTLAAAGAPVSSTVPEPLPVALLAGGLLARLLVRRGRSFG